MTDKKKQKKTARLNNSNDNTTLTTALESDSTFDINANASANDQNAIVDNVADDNVTDNVDDNSVATDNIDTNNIAVDTTADNAGDIQHYNDAIDNMVDIDTATDSGNATTDSGNTTIDSDNTTADNGNTVTVDVATDNMVGVDTTIDDSAANIDAATESTASPSIEDALLASVNQSIVQPTANVPIPPTLAGGAADNNAQPKNKKNKKKIIWISVLASILILTITLSIALPLVFYYKDKTMVNSADDFAYKSGKYFVLTKDVTVNGDLDLSNMPCNIDFNKHTLNISGSLIFNSDNPLTLTYGDIGEKAEKPVDKDSDKPKKPFKRGIINATNIQITAPNMAFDFGVQLNCDTLAITAKDVTINGGITTMLGKTPVVATDGNANSTCSFINCAKVTINNVANSVSFKNSNLVLSENAIANDIHLDNASSAQVFGTIEVGIFGGKKVAIFGDVKTAKDIQLVATMSRVNIVNCGHIVLLDKLASVSDFVIEKQPNNNFQATVAPVFNAQKYAIEVNGQTILSDSNIINLTEAMSALDAGKYTISAYAVGNFDFEKLNIGDTTLFVNGDKKTIQFEHTVTLTAPQNIKVEANNNKLALTFDSVAFADKYTIYQDGVLLKTIKDKNSKTFEIDITSALNEAGMHSFTVIAHSKNNKIEDSAVATTSYTTQIQLPPILNLNCQYENGSITLNWSGSSNSKLYRVYALKEDNSIVQLGVTGNISFFAEYPNAAKTDRICIVAEGYACYTSSVVASVFILPQA